MSTGQQQNTPQGIPSLGMSVSVLAGELPTPSAGGGAPEWIKVTPRGQAKTRDGRTYNFNPEALAARFKTDAIEIPVDLDHALAHRATKGERVDAVGYAAELQARADGTYARVNWLDGGLAVLSARTHRYVSPTFPHDAAGNATWLHSISLVAAPALSMPALAAAMPGAAQASTIAEALGLDAGSDEAACLAAIGTLREQFVPVTLFADALAALTVTREQMAALQAKVRTDRVSAMLAAAAKDGKMTPAQMGQYEALCATDAGLAHVTALLANTLPQSWAKPSGLDQQMPRTGEPERLETLMVRAKRYREAQAAAGIALNHAEATRFAHENPTAGL